MMRKKVRWHRIRNKKEHRVNAKWKEEALKANECLTEVLKCEAEHGPLFCESDEYVEMRIIEYFLNHVEIS